jgi:nucleoside 2-deoxyribosyltransferase
MKLVYVAGKYTDTCAYLVERNIDVAKNLAIDVWKLGAAAICPHTNSAHFEGAASGQAFIDGTLEMMRRCDAVLVCPNWTTSSGTKGEIAEAERLGIPVFYYLNDLRDWLEQS